MRIVVDYDGLRQKLRDFEAYVMQRGCKVTKIALQIEAEPHAEPGTMRLAVDAIGDGCDEVGFDMLGTTQ